MDKGGRMKRLQAGRILKALGRWNNRQARYEIADQRPLETAV